MNEGYKRAIMELLNYPRYQHDPEGLISSAQRHCTSHFLPTLEEVQIVPSCDQTMEQGTHVSLALVALCSSINSRVIVTRHYDGDIYYNEDDINGTLISPDSYWAFAQ